MAFLDCEEFFRATPTAPESYMLLLWKSVNGLPVMNGVEAANRPSYAFVPSEGWSRQLKCVESRVTNLGGICKGC